MTGSAGVTAGGSPRESLRERVELVEEAYEFFLAYAAQGMTGAEGRPASSTLRSYLDRVVPAVEELAPLLARVVQEEGLEPADRLHAFREVIAADAERAGAALALVASRPAVSSALVDNLNASVHLRALLTDLFLLDELLELKVPVVPAGRIPAADR